MKDLFNGVDTTRIHIGGFIFVLLLGMPMSPYLKIGLIFMVGIFTLAIYLMSVEVKALIALNKSKPDTPGRKVTEEMSTGSLNHLSIFGIKQLATQGADEAYQDYIDEHTDAILDVLLVIDGKKEYETFFASKVDILYAIEDATIQSLQVSRGISAKIKEITKTELIAYSSELISKREEVNLEAEAMAKVKLAEIEKNLEQSIRANKEKEKGKRSNWGEQKATADGTRALQELDEYIKNVKNHKAS